MHTEKIRQAVRENYAHIAKADADKKSEKAGCGCSATSGCCDSKAGTSPEEISVSLGYSKEEVSKAPKGANMGLGCGNPQAIANLKPGETVIDLGSGGGFDCFLAARAVGKSGRVIGIDMTPDMISKARANAEKAGLGNVEFRLGEIEHLPVADATADVIISNCVINLSPEKQKVYDDAFRALKPGGRLAISDVVTLKTLPGSLQKDIKQYTGCIAGASMLSDLEKMLQQSGFTDIRVELKAGSKEFIDNWLPGSRLGDFIASAAIQAIKP